MRTNDRLTVVKVMLGRRTHTRCTARPRVERGLAGHVGREARRIDQHADRTQVDDMAFFLRHHARQQADRAAQAAKVVALHRALKIIEPVVAGLDGAADRAPGVVDQKIDAAVPGLQRLDKFGATGLAGDVHRVAEHLGLRAGVRGDLLHGGGQLVFTAAADERDGAGLGKPAGRCQPAAR